MAGRPYTPFIGPSEPLLDRKASSQRSINLYMAEVEGGGEDKQFILESAPGLQQMAAASGEVRGVCIARDQWYEVVGSELFVRDDDWTPSLVGEPLSTNTGFVRMVEMRDMIVIVDGDYGYVYNLDTGVFSQITDPDWRGSDWVSTLDGYAIFSEPGTDQFYISAIDDAATLDALDFSSADKNPDVIVTHRVVGNQLLMMGKRSIEIYVNSGEDFPFARYTSAPIEVGVVGNRAAINAAETLYWVGQTGRGVAYLYELQGNQPVRISTQAVEESLLACTDLTQVSMWTYQAEGAEFVAVNGPGIPTTWVFDISTRKWHERCELIDGSYQALRADQVLHHMDKLYATSSGGQIHLMSRNIHYIVDGPLVRERTWPHLIKPSFEPVAYRGLELMCTTGYDGAEGHITLEISNDGGYTWGPPLIRSLGAIGRYMQRIRWLMLGTSRDRVFRVRVTDQVPVTFHAAVIDA